MATRILYRSRLQRCIAPMTLGISTSLVLAARRRPLFMDSLPASRSFSSRPDPDDLRHNEWLHSQTVTQLSSGSLSGFVVGLLSSVFSRTLTLLAGLAFVAVQLASRYGIDLVQQLKLKQRVKSSRVLSALGHNPVFRLSFGVCFALSAFLSF